MKKLLFGLLMVAGLMVATSGCGGGVDNSTSVPENVGPAPSDAPTDDAPPPVAAPTP
ncbi:MAG: hypothetical protein J5I93_06995 [Pirellulaceae bacterium]|nr:hypothetical protein [Pirellulaceae bacterium]